MEVPPKDPGTNNIPTFRGGLSCLLFEKTKNAKNFQVFQDSGIESFLDSVLDGYHATVFAYGRQGMVKLENRSFSHRLFWSETTYFISYLHRRNTEEIEGTHRVSWSCLLMFHFASDFSILLLPMGAVQGRREAARPIPWKGPVLKSLLNAIIPTKKRNELDEFSKLVSIVFGNKGLTDLNKSNFEDHRYFAEWMNNIFEMQLYATDLPRYSFCVSPPSSTKVCLPSWDPKQSPTGGILSGCVWLLQTAEMTIKNIVQVELR